MTDQVIDQKKLDELLNKTAPPVTVTARVAVPVATTAAPPAPTPAPATVTVAPPAPVTVAPPAPVAVIAEPPVPPPAPVAVTPPAVTPAPPAVTVAPVEPDDVELPRTHVDKDGIRSFMEGYQNSRYPINKVAFVCSGYGCQYVSKFEFPNLLISQLNDLFAGVNNPEDERKQLAKAIGLIERTAGPVAGTSRDRPSMDFGGSGDSSQLDCSDEALNTTSYMVIMYKMGLIKFHSIERPDWKGIPPFKWTHQTAVITDETTNVRWAVDSGTGRNGAVPTIIEYNDWYE
jgi:hypothetical protein